MADGLRPLIEALDAKLERMQKIQSERHEENIANIATLRNHQEHLEESVDDLKKELFGNGQPGLIAKLEGRIVTLESFLWKVKGSITATSAIGTLLGAIVATLIELWVRKH